MAEPVDRNAGYDDWLDAVERGEGDYLACPDGHGSLPPRRACPRCGATELEAVRLPATGRVVTYTVVHVSTPQLADDTPYTTAIADFGAVRLTGFLRGVDLAAVETGLVVEPSVGRTATTGQRAVVLRPASGGASP